MCTLTKNIQSDKREFLLQSAIIHPIKYLRLKTNHVIYFSTRKQFLQRVAFNKNLIVRRHPLVYGLRYR